MRVLIVIIVIIGLVFAYFFYVRGVSVLTILDTPLTVVIDDKQKTFSWELLKALPTPRSEVAVAGNNEAMFVIGGFNEFAETEKIVERYAYQTNEWSSFPDLPEPRHHAAAVIVRSTLYVIGGFTGKVRFTPQRDIFSIDLTKPFAWERETSMPTARGALATADWNGKIYLIGGVSENGVTNVLEVYDTRTRTWDSNKLSMPTKRDHLAAGFIRGKLYVAGGRQNSVSKNVSALEIYDPLTGLWHDGPSMKIARSGIAGGVVNNLFIIVGGETRTKTFRTVEAFSPTENAWISLPDMPTPRHGLGVASTGNRLYVGSGGKNPALSVSDRNEVLLIK